MKSFDILTFWYTVDIIKVCTLGTSLHDNDVAMSARLSRAGQYVL